MLRQLGGHARTNLQPAALPGITIVVPVLNEQRYISACLDALAAQDYAGPTEILVLDGGSTDGTQDLVRKASIRRPTIRLFANPGRLQSSACNRAAELASADTRILIRADAHSGYPACFVTRCVAAMRQDGVTSVVVPLRTVGDAGLQSVIALTQNSLLGNGGSRHRRGARDGFVQHGHHAAFDLAFFRRVGGYDERFSHNEDAELDHRMHAAGGKVWMCRDAEVTYFPRCTWHGLASQYFNHGRGRARMLLTHHVCPHPRQMAPLVALLMVMGGLAMAPLSAWWAFLPCIYLGFCCYVGLVCAASSRSLQVLMIGPIAITMHMSWACGAIYALATWPGFRKPARVATAINTLVPTP